MDRDDEEFAKQVFELWARGEHHQATTRLRSAGVSDRDIGALFRHFEDERIKFTEQQGRGLWPAAWDAELLLPLGGILAGLICYHLFFWIYEKGGCIAGVALGGFCVFDTLWLTIVGSAGLIALAAVFASLLSILFQVFESRRPLRVTACRPAEEAAQSEQAATRRANAKTATAPP
jgi:hypothetical protein